MRLCPLTAAAFTQTFLNTPVTLTVTTQVLEGKKLETIEASPPLHPSDETGFSAQPHVFALSALPLRPILLPNSTAKHPPCELQAPHRARAPGSDSGCSECIGRVVRLALAPLPVIPPLIIPPNLTPPRPPPISLSPRPMLLLDSGRPTPLTAAAAAQLPRFVAGTRPHCDPPLCSHQFFLPRDRRQLLLAPSLRWRRLRSISSHLGWGSTR